MLPSSKVEAVPEEATAMAICLSLLTLINNNFKPLLIYFQSTRQKNVVRHHTVIVVDVNSNLDVCREPPKILRIAVPILRLAE